MLDAVQNAIIVTDLAGRIVFWNHFAEQLYGWSAEEVVGLDVNEITPADQQAARGAMASIVAGQTWSGEFRVKRKSGETFPAYVTTSAISDAEGRVTGLVGVSFDLTAQRARDQRYETLFKTMSEGFAVCEAIRDENGGLTDYLIVEINPALKAMLGVDEDLAGRKLSQTGFGGQAWLALCDGVLRTGAPARFEFHHADADRWYEIGVNRLAGDRMAQFFFDTTERKRAELKQAGLFDELNHRVKNNLMLVASFLQVQARDAHPNVREQLGKAVDRVHSIAQVHTALHRGQRRDTVEFAAYLQDLCASLSQSLIDDDRITLDVEAEAIELSIDTAIALGMVVNELVTNAVKYAYPPPETGAISVRFESEGGGVLLAVGDGGHGLPQRTTKSASGLGMKLVASLAAQVGGDLTIRNHPGATFEIRIPHPATT